MFANSTSTGRNITVLAHEKIGVNGDSLAVTVAKSIVFFTTITATLLGNSLIYASMKKFRALRTPTNIVLCSLATTDLTMVVVMVLHAVTDLSGHWTFGPIWCDIVATLGLVLALISILHLCSLSIDRYLAIKSPLRYPVIVTRRKVYVLLIMIWILPTIFLNLPAADYRFRSDVYGCAFHQVQDHTTSLQLSPYIFIIVTLFVAIPFGIMFYTHSVVFCVALSHVKRMSTVERRLQETTTTTESSESNREAVHLRVKPHTTVLLKREIKSAKTFALVIGVFLFCYTPFFITGTYRKVAGPEKVPALATFVTTWLAFANSFSNPLVYSLRYSPFKRAFMKLCCVRLFRSGESSFTFSRQTKMSRLQREKPMNNIEDSASIKFKEENVGNVYEGTHGNEKGLDNKTIIVTAL